MARRITKGKGKFNNKLATGKFDYQTDTSILSGRQQMSKARMENRTTRKLAKYQHKSNMHKYSQIGQVSVPAGTVAVAGINAMDDSADKQRVIDQQNALIDAMANPNEVAGDNATSSSTDKGTSNPTNWY